jgi:hypothetical protein
MKAELKELERSRPGDLPNKGKHQIKNIFTAVVLLVVFVTCLLLLRTCNSTPIEKELYASYYEKYPNVLDPITKSGKESDQLSISQNYELGNFEAAIMEGEKLEIGGFEKAQNQSQEFIGGRLYLALSYMEVKDYENAQRIFGSMPSNQGIYREAIIFYHALSFLTTGEKEKAKSMLTALTSSVEIQGPYGGEAAEIIKVLEE